MAVTDVDDGQKYYAQLRGFLEDQYYQKSAVITWLIPSPRSHHSQNGFDPSHYVAGFIAALLMLIFYSDWVILCLYSSTWFSAGWQWHLTSSSSCQLDNAAWPCDAARPAFIIFINSDASGGRLTLIWRRHSFTPYVMSRVDYSNAILAAALKTTTDRLQRVLNAAARVVSDTKKSDQGLSRLMHQELHWLDISERVNYKLGVLTHRCLLGKAPVYLSNSQTAAFQSVK